jgi:diguanylate cyclase (GGDEF)-like protein
LKCFAAVQYAATGDEEFMTMVSNCRKQVDKEVSAVEGLYKADPTAQENVKRMSEVAQSLGTVCDNVLASKEADRDISSLQCPTVKARWQDFLAARDTLLSAENARHNELVAKLPQSHKKLEEMISIGIGVNLILAVILMRFLGVGIASRIKQLTVNSKLLAEGKPLSGSLDKGNDEITLLDSAFRKMASDLQEAMDREAAQARTDSLSGLNNRLAFNETMEHLVAIAARTNKEISLLICDIDHFKSINDRFGHGTGDEAIKAVAAAILSVIRKSDFSARWGGEEFIVGMPNTDRKGAQILAERLRAAVANIELPTTAGIIHFTTSIGVAVLDEKHESTENCIQRADTALYNAKKNGRNRVELADVDGTMRLPRMLPPA